MKVLVLLCDGMADTPVPKLGGKTPMEAAKKPNMDALAGKSRCGLAKTVPDGMKPGSDVANLSVMGYDPSTCYTGRSPLEAASIGIDLKEDEYALRCNLVTLSDDPSYSQKVMEDYCGGDISTEEAAELIRFLDRKLPDGFRLYPGVSYRHCLTWKNPSDDLGEFTPPHDISGQRVGHFLPDPDKAGPLLAMMVKSYNLLMGHPVNQKRIAAGLRPANGIWLWGQGRRASLERFADKFGCSAAVVSAVDLIKGIGKLAQMEVLEVPGATGYIDTNFDGKAAAAVGAFQRGADLVYLHIEAPDECGHRGEAENKVRSIELIDQKVLGPVKAALEQMGPYRILVMPDHPTPLDIMTHTSAPVPYLLYDSEAPAEGPCSFTEAQAAGGDLVDPATKLMGMLTRT